MNQITVDAIVKNVDIVTEFVNAELEKFDCPMKTEMQINVAIDEVFGNIAQYAYPGGDGQATIRFAVEEDPLTAVITFIDSGIPYNPLNAETPDVTLSVEERNIGGLGIYLVRKTMDDVSYEYKDGQNILTLRKKF